MEKTREQGLKVDIDKYGLLKHFMYETTNPNTLMNM